MKKLLVLLLLMVSTNVFAEWTRVNGSTDGNVIVYVDYGTIRRKGNKVKMWSLFDYKKVQIVANTRYLSDLTRYEYACEEETTRVLDFYWHSRNMRSGDIVYSSTNMKNEGTSIIPGSINEGLFKIACSNK